MPVTKTAKRALRGSKRKQKVNKSIIAKLEIAMREAKLSKKTSAVQKAVSLLDRANKKKVIHKNKAARIKSQLSKLVRPIAKPKKKTTSKKR
jgi:small subunit ribosomal protein S20